MNWIRWNNITSKSIFNTNFNTGKQRHKSPYRQHFELVYQITLVLLCCTVHKPDWQVNVWNVPHHCLLRFVIFALEKQRENKNNAVPNEACFTGTLMEQLLEKKQWSAFSKYERIPNKRRGNGCFCFRVNSFPSCYQQNIHVVKEKREPPNSNLHLNEPKETTLWRHDVALCC